MFMLLAAQATGLVMGYGAKRRQKRELGQQRDSANRYIAMGGELERSELSLRMQEELLSSTEQALYNAEQLREVLSSQNVLAAARGQKTGVGTQRAITNKSLQEHGRDEEARKLSLNFKQYNISNMQRLSQLNQIRATSDVNQNYKSRKQELSDTFRQKIVDVGGGIGTSLFGFGEGSPRKAPVVKSKGIDLGPSNRRRR